MPAYICWHTYASIYMLAYACQHIYAGIHTVAMRPKGAPPVPETAPRIHMHACGPHACMSRHLICDYRRLTGSAASLMPTTVRRTKVKIFQSFILMNCGPPGPVAAYHTPPPHPCPHACVSARAGRLFSDLHRTNEPKIEIYRP